MKEVQLVGCVLPDPQNVSRIYLVHRRDHGQWQFPGGEKNAGETLEDAAIRHLEGKVGIVTSPENIRLLGRIAAILGDVTYEAEMVALRQWDGEPMLAEWGQYDNYGYFNVLGYGIGHHVVSPLVEEFGRDVNNEKLPFWRENPVQ